ncbi:MAG TPA: hypothetical protein VJS64_08775 [Pyrinomonadaceae bacterium]|nr:hypothetical protein [Pyrinomonadaceae bacterium]
MDGEEYNMKSSAARRSRSKKKQEQFPFNPYELPMHKGKKNLPYSFVFEELAILNVTSKPMFGFMYVYLGEKLILLLRERENQPERNGLWLATTSEHLASLREEFPLLPSSCVIHSDKNGWLFLPARLEIFESYAVKACGLIANGDTRIGVVAAGQKRFWRV